MSGLHVIGQVSSNGNVIKIILVRHVHSRRVAKHHAHLQAYMRSEDSAKRVQNRYADCALDGQPLKVQLCGAQAKHALSSGLTVEKVKSGAAGGTRGGAAPASNAFASAMRSATGGNSGGGGGAPARGRGSQQSGGMRAY